MSFEFETSVDVRYTDVDTYGHVNNAVYATLLEEARIDYLEAVLGDAAGSLTAGDGAGAEGKDAGDGTGSGEDGAGEAGGSDDVGVVLADLELDFRRPVGLRDAVTVAVRVPRLGESSFLVEYEIRADDAVAAVGETTIVAYDRRTESSRPLPDAWRERIAEFEGL